LSLLEDIKNGTMLGGITPDQSVVPRGLLYKRLTKTRELQGIPIGFSDDPDARRRIELVAMGAVMDAECALGVAAIQVNLKNLPGRAEKPA